MLLAAVEDSESAAAEFHLSTATQEGLGLRPAPAVTPSTALPPPSTLCYDEHPHEGVLMSLHEGLQGISIGQFPGLLIINNH